MRRARLAQPVVISVHGGDVLAVAADSPAGARAVSGALGSARLVLANSRAIEDRARSLGARATRVVHLGTDVPERHAHEREREAPLLVTLGHLVARKRHADVLRALWLLADQHPGVSWEIVGDGPERPALERFARDLGLAERVRFLGQLAPDRALEATREGDIFVLPSIDEAFGVAYIEAMAAGMPAIGCRGEPGPEEIAAAGQGMRLVAPGDPEALAAELHALLVEPRWRRELGAAARATVQASFTWEACGRATVAAYEEALR